jgi:ABC-type amino acid transport substrate-binding protein
MKRFCVAGIFCVGLGIVAALTTPVSAADGDSTQSLLVAVKPIEPFVYLSEGKPKGFSIDLIESIGRKI